MTDNDTATVMENSLLAIADANVDIVPVPFARFFASYPEQRAAFTNLEAAQGRMTNETLDALLGLARHEYWVPVTIANFVDLHRNYGVIPLEQYSTFVNLLVDVLAESADAAWTEEQARAWKAQAIRLNDMIAEALAGKTPAMCD